MRRSLKLYFTGFFSLLCTLLYICSLFDIEMDDIHERLNLGFNNEIVDSCDYLDYGNLTNNISDKNNLTVLQLNICGILNKQDKLKTLLNDIEMTAEWMLLC